MFIKKYAVIENFYDREYKFLHETLLKRYDELSEAIHSYRIKEIKVRLFPKHTESYTSDIFYDLQKLWNDLKGDTTILYNQPEYKNVIAIRDMGTDGESFILTRNAGESDTFEYLYKTIF